MSERYLIDVEETKKISVIISADTRDEAMQLVLGGQGEVDDSMPVELKIITARRLED